MRRLTFREIRRTIYLYYPPYIWRAAHEIRLLSLSFYVEDLSLSLRTPKVYGLISRCEFSARVHVADQWWSHIADILFFCVCKLSNEPIEKHVDLHKIFRLPCCMVSAFSGRYELTGCMVVNPVCGQLNKQTILFSAPFRAR